MSDTINRTWFKNRLRKGELLVRCKGKYTDDYAYDAATGYSTEKEFRLAPKDMFLHLANGDNKEWYISRSYIYGEKTGIIHLSFASCEYYEFKLAA